MDQLVAVGPWFRRRPQHATVVIGVLFVAVTALRVLVGDERDATGLLYALPVALAAMAFGRVVGTAAACTAAALLWAWVVSADDITLSALGWASRLLPLVLLGPLVGSASDAAEEAAETRLALAVADARRRDAAEVNDAILQRLTVVKWRMEAGASEETTALLDEAMGEAQRLVSSLLEGQDLDDRLRVKALSTDDQR